MSAARDRALAILHPRHPLRPELFAHFMWPESRSWRGGPRSLAGVRLSAWAFLARLARDGLAELRRDGRGAALGYVLTAEGDRMLAERAARAKGDATSR